METQEKTISGSVYTVRELPMKELRPIMEDGSDNLQDNLIKAAVLKDGMPIEQPGELGWRQYRPLWELAAFLNGLDVGDDTEEKS